MTAVPREDGEIMADASVGKLRHWVGGGSGSESVMEETTTNLQHV